MKSYFVKEEINKAFVQEINKDLVFQEISLCRRR